MRRRIARFALVLALVYVALALAACVSMRRFLFPAPRPPAPVASAPGLELLRVDEGGAAPVFALYAAPRPGFRTVVHFHGNGEELADQRWLGERMREVGLGFAAVEYPGYGPSSAQSASEAALYASAERALGYLRTHRGLAREDTVLMGQSLGTGVAVEMAARGHAGRLVLISPFTSMVDVVQRIVFFLPAGLLVRDRFDSASKAAGIHVPVLLLHGSDDTLVPAEMSAVLARRFPQSRRVVLPGRGHNDVWSTPGDALFAAVAEFAVHAHGL